MINPDLKLKFPTTIFFICAILLFFQKQIDFTNFNPPLTLFAVIVIYGSFISSQVMIIKRIISDQGPVQGMGYFTKYFGIILIIISFMLTYSLIFIDYAHTNISRIIIWSCYIDPYPPHAFEGVVVSLPSYCEWVIPLLNNFMPIIFIFITIGAYFWGIKLSKNKISLQ